MSRALEDINCNIFCDLDGDDYKKVLAELKHAILSTNLNRYKNQCENLRHFIGSDLDMQREDVRDAVKSVLMMTCDLCANWKPWPVHKNAVWSLYKEFFKQGDLEMEFDIESPPQMMRMNAEEIPKYQVSL
ncbi:putative 3',5'-cyclic phosphodiesterase pde-5, partial [Stegodyphus mimosarum]